MSDTGFFKFERDAEHKTTCVRCAFCNRIRWAGLDEDLPQSLAICGCDGSWQHAGSLKEPAVLYIEREGERGPQVKAPITPDSTPSP